MISDPATFVRTHTRPGRPPLVPEIELFLADKVTPLWEAIESASGVTNPPPPYWAFAWPGGQAVARHLLDHPELVAGRRVLDFAAGGGLLAIAAARLGARSRAVEIDRLATAAIGLNTAINGVEVEAVCEDLVGRDLADIDVIVAGDVCYERPMAERVISWLRLMAARGVLVLIGDPGRAYLPKAGMEKLATHAVATTLDLEDREERVTSVWRLLPK